jgi:hypothetical protein
MGSTDAFESANSLIGLICFTRITDAAVARVAQSGTHTGPITVAGGTAMTSITYGVGSVVGATNASNSFTITITIDSGAPAANQCVMLAELINSEASGCTIAAA